MHLVVTNNWVRVSAMDRVLARSLDAELRYPTEQARLGGNSDWDGWVRLLRPSKDGWSFPTGLLPRAIRHARRMGFGYSLDDRRVRPPRSAPWARPIALFDYQREAVEVAVEAGRGVVDSPPRSGKTRLMTEVVRRLALPTLWVAPTDRIVKQSVATLQQFLGTDHVLHLVGGSRQAEAALASVVVCTTATAAGLKAAFFQSRQVIVVDEWHHAAAVTYRNLFKSCEHVFYRFGMTGTHYRSGEDGMAMEALLSNTVYRIGSEELVGRGRLVPLDVVFVPTRFPTLRGVNASDFIGGFGKYGAFEHVGRNQLVAHTAAFLARQKRRVVVLIRTKAQGRQVTEILRGLMPKNPPGTTFAPVEFVSTDVRRKRIDEVIEAFVSSDEVRVLVGTSMIGEGTDLPIADALVYAAAGSAEVTLMQNAYRVCTAMDGKPPRALLVDFADRHHHKLLAQGEERLRVYRREPIFTTQVIPTPRDLLAWMQAQGHAAPPAEVAAS